MSSTASNPARPASAGRDWLARLASERVREALVGYALILPLFIGVAVLFFYPIGRSIQLSFMKTGIFKGETFAGLMQYQRLFEDPVMWQSIGNTFIYAGIALFQIPIAIFFAALLNARGLRLVGFYRVLFFLPVVTMPAAVGIVWTLLYNTDYGVINQALGAIGIPGVAWLTQPGVVLVAVGLVGIWSGLGHSIVLILSGLQTVPSDLQEAAELDGAGPVMRFLTITLPMISPTVFLVSVLNIIGSLQVFDLMYMMISPNNPVFSRSHTIVYYFFETGFVEHNRGYAAAIAIVLLAIIMAITGLQFWLQRKWVHYGR